MTLKRMDNVLIVVDDLEAVKAFFIELGLELEGETRSLAKCSTRTRTGLPTSGGRRASSSRSPSSSARSRLAAKRAAEHVLPRPLLAYRLARSVVSYGVRRVAAGAGVGAGVGLG
jgi:hypothetical protein